MRNAITGSLERLANIFVGKAESLNWQPCKPVTLPIDLYAHSDSQTEWWYYTGHCATESGNDFGFELVFFRRRTDKDIVGVIPLRLLANPVFAAHFAITDLARGEFRYRERQSLRWPFSSNSGASADTFDVKIGDWLLGGDENEHHLRATTGRDLVFTAALKPQKPMVQNGHGIPNKGGSQTNSQHFSFTRLSVEGELEENGKNERFTGTAWMDREYGTWFQRHWDWFSIQLNNECELMLYQFRNPSGSISKDSHGTFVDSDGLCTILRESDFTVAPKRVWVSPRTGVNYPSGWRIGVRSLDLELDVDPCLSDQELDTRKSTMVIYWEGACSVSGSSKNSEVNGNAYVELVGYDQGATGPTFVRFLKSMLGK